MRKKIFVLPLSLLTAAGWIACSDDPAEPTPPATDSGAPQGTRGGPCYPNQTCNEGLVCQEGIVCLTRPAEPTSDAASDTGADANDGSVACKKTGLTFTPPIYRVPAQKLVNACSDTAIQALADGCFKAPESAACAAAQTSVGAGCAGCAFGFVNDFAWKPIVLTGSTPPSFYNLGGCIDTNGGPQDCGKNYVTVVACFDAYCSTCAPSDLTLCQKEVAQVSLECAGYLINQDCGMTIETTAKKCFPADETDAGRRAQFVALVANACK